MAKESLIHLLEERMKLYRLPLMPVIWGLTLTIIGVLIVIGFYGYYSTEKAVAIQFNNQQLMLAKQAAQGIEKFLADAQETAALITQFPAGQNSQPLFLPAVSKTLGDKVRFLFLTDGNGKINSAYPGEILPAIVGKDFSSSPYFQKIEHTGKPILIDFSLLKGKVFPDASLPAEAILIATPIRRGAEFAGILGLGLSLGQINERYLHPLRSGARGGFWMINATGRFTAHHDPELLGQNAFSALREQGSNRNYDRLERIMKEEMLRGKSGVNEYIAEGRRGSEGETKKLIAYAPIQVGDQVWSLAVVAPYSDVTQVVWASFKNSVLLLAIMAGTLLAGTYFGQKINQGRIRAEEKVKWGEEIIQTQNRLQTLFDGSPDAIAIVEKTYRISMVNKTVLDWYKKSVDEFRGKICYQEFQRRVDPCPNCPVEESFRTGQPAFRERASLVADGAKRYLQLYTFPLGDRHGEVKEVVEYVKDVTAERKLQQQIIQAERLAVVGRMSASVAHEIKNPLGTIVLNTELLEEELARLAEKDTAEAKNLLGVIKSELDHLLAVIEEYLQFARLPKVRLEKGKVNETVADLLLFLKEEAAERQVLIVEDLGKDIPLVQLDGKQLRQALLNIVKNSFEAMPEGGKLTITTTLSEGQIEISIADTGRGIPEENLEMIFTPFFSTKHGGTGLGLAITSHIIQEHRGTIAVQSYKDLGTIFTIRLPAQPSDPLASAGEKIGSS